MDILEGAIKHRNIHGLEIGIIFVNKQNVSKQKETFVNDFIVLKILLTNWINQSNNKLILCFIFIRR